MPRIMTGGMKGVNGLPLTECLKDTVERVVPYWEEHVIVPDIKAGKQRADRRPR